MSIFENMTETVPEVVGDLRKEMKASDTEVCGKTIVRCNFVPRDTVEKFARRTENAYARFKQAMEDEIADLHKELREGSENEYRALRHRIEFLEKTNQSLSEEILSKRYLVTPIPIVFPESMMGMEYEVQVLGKDDKWERVTVREDYDAARTILELSSRTYFDRRYRLAARKVSPWLPLGDEWKEEREKKMKGGKA